MIVGVRPAGIHPWGQPTLPPAMDNRNVPSSLVSYAVPSDPQHGLARPSLLPGPPGPPPVQDLSRPSERAAPNRPTSDPFPVPDPPAASQRYNVSGRKGQYAGAPGPSSSGVQKHKPTRRAGRGRRHRGTKGAGAAQHTSTGTPSLASLTKENRRKTRGHFKKGRGGSGKKSSKSGAVFPATPKFALGAPTMRNESLMRPRAGGYGSVRDPEMAPASAERGIIGVGDSSSAYSVYPQPLDYGMDPEQPALDFFGSNEGLIFRREESPVGRGSSGSGSEDEETDSDNAEDNGPGDVNMRGVELHLDDARAAMRQRQQEHRISHQAEYILQLEDDNLALRGNLLKKEDEIESLRRREDEHLNLQERFYLLQEEMKQLRRSSALGNLSSPAAGDGPGERIWDE